MNDNSNPFSPGTTDQAAGTPARNDGSDPLASLPVALQNTLRQKGFSVLTPVQRAVAAAATQERDLRISSQTGSGKTVAIGLALGRTLLDSSPREQHGPSALVLTPTRELAGQVQQELGWLLREIPDCRVEVVTGGTSVGAERKRLASNPRMVVGTPGRVLDHLERGGFRGDHIEQVILDEADQMLELGFRDELNAILEHLPKERRTHFVSATFSKEVEAVAQRHQTSPLSLEGSPLGQANQDIVHLAHVIPLRHRHDALVNLLLVAQADASPANPLRTLVFTRTRADAWETATKLQREGFRAEPLSGDLAQAQRTRTLSSFRSGQVQIVVATDVAARGIDVGGIDRVIHLEPPSDPDSFTHRSGRTGRAGRKGTSILLLPPQARRRVERLLDRAGVAAQWAPVPGPDKIKKLYAKLPKRRLFESLDQPAQPEHIEYANKLLQEHEAAEVIARLLEMIQVEPVCPPREISSHLAGDHRGPGAKPFRAGRHAGYKPGPKKPSGKKNFGPPPPKKPAGKKPLGPPPAKNPAGAPPGKRKPFRAKKRRE